MQFTREINRLLVGFLLSFGVAALSAAYWAVVGADTILKREDNPRRVLQEASIVRGDIFDRNDELLVTSVRGDDGIVTRRYLQRETDGALGYFSLRYGVGGVEAAYNTILRGDDLPRDLAQTLTDGLLHRPQHGSDIRLTFDLNLQRQIAAAMQGQQGAAVVLAVPSGEVLALVSLPTYDPNTLDANWDSLRESPGNPFFNRALQGNYQPGGALQTPLMAAAILDRSALVQSFEQGSAPVTLDNLTLNCAVRLPSMALTLRDAYAFACPSPFAALAAELGLQQVESAFETFRLHQPPTLPGFTAEPNADAAAPTAIPAPTEDALPEIALGQGKLTTTPMAMAFMAAAIINDGNAPQPYTLLDTRTPDSANWQAVEVIRPTIPVTTMNTARQLQDLMRYAVANGAAQNAGRPNIDIGGHAALAYSGDTSQAWFVGFATLGGRRGIAIAVVLEDSDDPGLAADIGGRALEAAHEALQRH